MTEISSIRLDALRAEYDKNPSDPSTIALADAVIAHIMEDPTSSAIKFLRDEAYLPVKLRVDVWLKQQNSVLSLTTNVAGTKVETGGLIILPDAVHDREGQAPKIVQPF